MRIVYLILGMVGLGLSGAAFLIKRDWTDAAVLLALATVCLAMSRIEFLKASIHDLWMIEANKDDR